MTDDLVKRLRKGDAMNGRVVNCKHDQCNCATMNEAADRIEALERELHMAHTRADIHLETAKTYRERAEAAEAERDEAKAMQECGCAYENPTDICAGHHALFERVYGVQRERLERERDVSNELGRALEEDAVQLRERLAKAVEAHQRIVQWADAYPLAVFPEPDFKAVQQALSAAGLSLDAVSASNMRHAVKGAGNISRAVLAEIEGGADV
jgi:hypothetical protein